MWQSRIVRHLFQPPGYLITVCFSFVLFVCFVVKDFPLSHLGASGIGGIGGSGGNFGSANSFCIAATLSGIPLICFHIHSHIFQLIGSSTFTGSM